MGLTFRLGNDGLGSRNGPWDAQFRGAEEDLGSLLSTCAEAVGWSYWCLAQLAAFNSCLAQVAVKFGRRKLPMRGLRIDAHMGIPSFFFFFGCLDSDKWTGGLRCCEM